MDASVDRGDLLVVGAGAVEVAWQVTPEVVVRLVEAGLGPVALSAAVNLGVDGGPVGVAAQMAFLLAVFYQFVPDVLPGAAGERAREERGFRAVTSASAGVFAFPVVLLVTGTKGVLLPNGRAVTWYLFGATAVTVVGMTAYLRASQEPPVSAPEGRARTVLADREWYDPAEARADIEQVGRWPRPVGVAVMALSAVGIGAAHVTPAVLFGLAAAALNAVFPVLEVLVLVGLLARVSDGSAGGERSVVRRLPDVEAVFYDNLTAASRGMEGAAATIVVVLGVFAPVATLVVVLAAGGVDPSWAASAWPLAAEMVGRWAAGTVTAGTAGRYVAQAVVDTGEFLALPALTGYAAWYWYRILRRLPAMLADDAGTVAGLLPSGEETAGSSLPARAPGLMVPAAALGVARRLEVVGSLSGVGSVYAPAAARWGFALAWPPLVAAMLWTVRAAWRRDRQGRVQPPASDRRALVVAFPATLVGSLPMIVGFRQAVGQTALTGLFLAYMFHYEHIDGRARDVAGGAGTAARTLAPVVGLVAAWWLGLVGIAVVAAGGVYVVMVAVQKLVERGLSDGARDPDG
jgi:hypothetical protein